MLRTIKSQLLCQLSYAPFARQGKEGLPKKTLSSLTTGACGWLRMSTEVAALRERWHNCPYKSAAFRSGARFALVQRFVSGNVR